ncbi:MAG: helix-turn-helix domain-containing protein [Methanocorpusculum sp.]|nr:helix-turn-helix domain-containing protein [Methanocorpusculum sp.]MDE2522503.1 helix-turn-helix domain-containing protein [Methanocorpusculum sp.]MDE2525089.1 helix-turn-helix domain-containing protein [Methanocorpusculum sp.]
MAVKEKGPYRCPVEVAFDFISGKWKSLIILCIAYDKVRYSDIKACLSTISPHILSHQLKSLESDGLIVRTQYGEIPLRVEYHLTEAGLKLLPILGSLGSWASAYFPDQVPSSSAKNCRKFFSKDNQDYLYPGL